MTAEIEYVSVYTNKQGEMMYAVAYESGRSRLFRDANVPKRVKEFISNSIRKIEHYNWKESRPVTMYANR